MNPLQIKLQTLRKQLNAAHLERKSVIDGLLATLLANQNALLYGPPGTGKSLILRDKLCDGPIEGLLTLGAINANTLEQNQNCFINEKI